MLSWTTWMDAAAVSHTPPGRPVQGLWVFRGSCLLRFSSWEPEAWKPILICHCISEVKRPLWKRSGGDAHLQLREAAGVNPRAKERTAAEGRSERRRKGEGGHTEPKTSPPRGSCRPDREHRSVTRDAEVRREPPKVSLGLTASHHSPEAPRIGSTLAPVGLHMLHAL